MKKTEITQERKILLGKIHIARKALGLDEETYRSVILNMPYVRVHRYFRRYAKMMKEPKK